MLEVTVMSSVGQIADMVLTEVCTPLSVTVTVDASLIMVEVAKPVEVTVSVEAFAV